MSLRPTRTFYGLPGPGSPMPAQSTMTAMLVSKRAALADPIEFTVANQALTVVVRVLEMPNVPVATLDGQAASCLSPFVPHAHVWRGGEWSCLGVASRAYTSGAAGRPAREPVRAAAAEPATWLIGTVSRE